ncbi:hypothetical protein B0H65DRAFT_21305 [Neurospora tetraspora]|uniref:Uncharacterized protein n=1 Tax=Neurospora tetraspora TaxID=94610 RepID=A0AAE0MX49_9PEZI|nr:hypothetical protein B0H65DRAFT_21305 [Neurospora tetraspora]
MNSNNHANRSALAALLVTLLLALNQIIIDTTINGIIAIDSFLSPLWTSSIIVIDRIFTATKLFTSGLGPTFQLSNAIGKTLQWMAKQVSPTTTVSEEESKIAKESLEFLESRIEYLTTFPMPPLQLLSDIMQQSPTFKHFTDSKSVIL